jgi:hypothetical protein
LNASLPVDFQLLPSAASVPATSVLPLVTVTAVTVAPPLAVTVTFVAGATLVAAAAGAITTEGVPVGPDADGAPDTLGAPEEPGVAVQCAVDVEHPLSRSAPRAAKVAAAVAGANLVRKVIKSLAQPGGIGRCVCEEYSSRLCGALSHTQHAPLMPPGCEDETRLPQRSGAPVG